MSGSQQANNTQPAATWTEPPWCGWIETTGDALLILEAARRGLIPRVTRRLVDSERKMIASGSVFVFDEDESGIKRWTDGFFWSPSRILGNFLLYRETDKRGSVGRGKGLDSPNECEGEGGKDGHALSRPKSDGALIMDKARERSLLGSLTNSYKFKPDGLMKKTFSLTIGGVAQHLISYYKVEDVECGRLRSPSSLPELASLDISPEYLDKTHFRNPPKVDVGPDGVPRYRGEADDIEPSPPLLSAPLSGLPLLTDGRGTDASSSTPKRNKRFDPYAPSATAKRSRKQPISNPDDPSSSTEHRVSPEVVTPTTPQPTANYPEPTSTAPAPGPPVSYPTYGMPAFYQVPGYPLPHPHIFPTTSAPYPHLVPQQPGHHPAQHSLPSTSGTSAGGLNESTSPVPPQQYYSYYPPPHPTYTTYPGVAWPYAGYPHPVHQMIPPPPMRDEDDKTDGGKEPENLET